MSDAEINTIIVMVLALVAWIVRLKWTNRKLTKQLTAQAAVPLATPAPALAIAVPDSNREMARLLERVAVLERITVEKEHTLARQIDGLRDR